VPTFDKTKNRYSRSEAANLRPSAAHPGGTENTTPVDTSGTNTLDLLLDVTAIGGTTPSLAVAIQTGNLADGSDAATVASFAAKTTVSSERKRFTGLGAYTRVQAVLTGTTPTATYSVTGTAK
jgi:hypothetical protein